MIEKIVIGILIIGLLWIIFHKEEDDNNYIENMAITISGVNEIVKHHLR